MFITFEGGDGSGKSTQIGLLAEVFAARGMDFVRTREPGGTRIGEKIRALILDPENAEMADVTEMLLYAATRAQLAREVVAPALAEGKAVLCDRWVDSSLVYQGVARGLGRAVAEVNHHATAGIVPDLTVLLDIDPAVGLARARGETALDRIEAEGLAWHERVRAGFLALAEKHPERYFVVDASGTPEAVHAEIAARVEALL
ncbi:MAG: dTMP kinase [Clostridiales Family XIII bacterium]|nr:dTMP kinase [Clostridiales Family XIII bacterium]